MSKENRFEVVLKEGGFSGPARKILLDTETGVQYLYIQDGYSGGLTVLVDRDGKPLLHRLTSYPFEE